MKIHEYQGKEILRGFGVPVPRGYPAFSVLEASEAAQRLGGVQGCTHLTELTQVLPTAVVQAFAGEVIDTRGDAEASTQPFQIDRCHALRADGPTVKTHYPRWYRAPQGSAAASSATSAAAAISET